MNDKEHRFARRFRDKAQGKILIDFLETQRSGLSDSLMVNRHGISWYCEFKSVEAKVRPGSCPLKGKFERGQIAFLRERRTWGMHGFVLAEIGGTPYLLNPMADLERMDMDVLRTEGASSSTKYIIQTGMSAIIAFLSELEFRAHELF